MEGGSIWYNLPAFKIVNSSHEFWIWMLSFLELDYHDMDDTCKVIKSSFLTSGIFNSVSNWSLCVKYMCHINRYNSPCKRSGILSTAHMLLHNLKQPWSLETYNKIFELFGRTQYFSISGAYWMKTTCLSSSLSVNVFVSGTVCIYHSVGPCCSTEP